MPLHARYAEDERRLDLTFSGNLDVTVALELCEICKWMSTDLRTCIIDLSGVERVFGSGIALLHMLYRKAEASGTRVVVVGDHPELHAYLPLIARADCETILAEGKHEVACQPVSDKYARVSLGPLPGRAA